MLNLLEVEGREELNGVHDAVGEGDHNASACEREVAPELVGDEGGFGHGSAVAHPEGEGEHEEDTEGEEGGGEGFADAGQVCAEDAGGGRELRRRKGRRGRGLTQGRMRAWPGRCLI
jgi:hypothetical protein